ncbi:MAG TPA: ATP-binding protein, partial [Terracidiphilus sp.]|nr:ATP-binding protein [Terracidiphilus sp.]
AVVELCNLRVTEAALPESVLHFVLRSQESVILNDAATDSSFAADPYVARRNVRSILCVPLLTGAKLVGALYLENNLAPGVFTQNRAPVLKLLASQAAVSLENTRLYRDLEEREARIRRLVEANIIGIFIWQRGGQILDANDALLRIVGYDREALVSGRIRWTDLTPPEFRERDAQAIEELDSTGTIQPYEKEYFRKDGSRVPILIGAATFEDGGNQGVAFVLDLTEPKHAALALQEVQTELAHTNRLAAMGQLTASIAHEVNQPLGAMVTNAQAGLRFLDARTPDLKEVREALASIVEGGHRASDVVSRIRAFVRKAPARMERFDMNEAIREVTVVARGEATKNGISVVVQLEEGLPPIDGDRIQLQQVVLNLMINAIEAMSGIGDGPRELRIETATSGSDSISVAVRDSGPGLDPGNSDHLFEAFYTTKAEGLGIGLSICRSIVEAHEGTLTARSNLPRGAIFEFTLPAHGNIFLNRGRPSPTNEGAN